MRNSYISIFIFCILLLISCKTSSKNSENNSQAAGHNSMNSLDWDGIYRGVFPCADCAGMQITITLNKDLSHISKDSYTLNGDVLTFNKARMAPLAVFKTVYMK